MWGSYSVREKLDGTARWVLTVLCDGDNLSARSWKRRDFY